MSDNGRSGTIGRRAFVKRSTALVMVCLGSAAGLLQACGSAPAPAPAGTASAPAPAATAPAPAATAGPTQAPAVKSAGVTPAPAATPAPTGAQPAARIKRGGVLRDVTAIQDPNMDAHLIPGGETGHGNLLYDTLLTMRVVDFEKETFELRPALAESWKVVDPSTVEFQLRRGVKFHDGSDFNAAVAAWNVERALTHAKSTVKPIISDVKRAEVVDDYTLRLHLQKPSGMIFILLSSVPSPRLGMVSKQAVEKLGDEQFGMNPVGTGPFKFKEWRKDDRVVLEKFPGHWEKGEDGQPLPYLDGYVVRYMTDNGAIMMELRARNVDLVVPRDNTDLPMVRADANLTAQKIPGLWISYPGMYINPRPNTPYPFSNDVRLREAAAHAIDHASMAKALGVGAAVPAYYPLFFPGMPGYDEKLPRREFNLAKAKQLLAEAGYANGIDLEVKVINRPGDVAPLEVLQSMWAAAGIRLKIAALDRIAWIDDGKAGKFEALSHGFQQTLEIVVGNNSRTGGTSNWSGYSRPEVDKLYAEAQSEYNVAKRTETYKKMVETHYKDAYFLTGYMYPRMHFMNKRVRDVTTMRLYRYIWLDQ